MLPKAFGIRLIDTRKQGWEADPDGAAYVEHLVHANEQLPSGPHHLPAETLFDGQTYIEVAVYEQAGQVESSDLSANKPVDGGAGVISGLPSLPKGSPFDIHLTVDSEGLLSVHAVEPSTGHELDIEFRISVLSKEEVSQAKQVVSGLAIRG